MEHSTYDTWVDIIIPVWTWDMKRDELSRCVNSILLNTNSRLSSAFSTPYRLILAASEESQCVNINKALDSCDSAFVCLLDWDVEVHGLLWLNKLLTTLYKHPDVGIVGGGLQPNNWYETVPEGYVGAFPTLAAGCMLFRNTDRRFDENFPHGWYADTDFCRQYREAGWDIWLDRTVQITHSMTHSTRDSSHVISESVCEAIYRDKWGDLWPHEPKKQL